LIRQFLKPESIFKIWDFGLHWSGHLNVIVYDVLLWEQWSEKASV